MRATDRLRSDVERSKVVELTGFRRHEPAEFRIRARRPVDAGGHRVRGHDAREVSGFQAQEKPARLAARLRRFVVTADSAIGVQVAERRPLDLVARDLPRRAPARKRLR